MTKRRYFGKQNSTLWSVVPLAMFLHLVPCDRETWEELLVTIMMFTD